MPYTKEAWTLFKSVFEGIPVTKLPGDAPKPGNMPKVSEIVETSTVSPDTALQTKQIKPPARPTLCQVIQVILPPPPHCPHLRLRPRLRLKTPQIASLSDTAPKNPTGRFSSCRPSARTGKILSIQRPENGGIWRKKSGACRAPRNCFRISNGFSVKTW